MAAESAALREAVGSVYRNTTRSIWFTILVTWVIAYMLWGIAPTGTLVAWAAVATLLHLARFAHVLWRLRAPDFLARPRHEERAFALGLFLAGASFAIGFLLLALHAPLLEQYAITLFVVGLSAGAATTLTGCRKAFLAYTMPIVVVIAGYMLWCGVVDNDGQRGFLGLMATLYAIAIAVFQQRLERAYMDSIRLRFEKDDLLAQKDALLAQLESRNQVLSADREEFLAASLTDGLTGLANRRHFDRTLARDWERSRREGTPLACIMLDLDHFKHYNDRYGHMTGDDCLRAVASLISETASRGGDFAARYGGEEFVVILPGTDARGATLIAERVRAAVEARTIPHAGGGPARVVTLSAGVASLTPGTGVTSSQTLVDLADEALYQAKKRGRNRVVISDECASISVPDGVVPGV